MKSAPPEVPTLLPFSPGHKPCLTWAFWNISATHPIGIRSSQAYVHILAQMKHCLHFQGDLNECFTDKILRQLTYLIPKTAGSLVCLKGNFYENFKEHIASILCHSYEYILKNRFPLASCRT